ncbi:Sef1p NDAI_0E04190 [Naumovozyma dairenensis CBS 421]|uniref:Zn(2)-C6 fungal-type domain-containing protein n=1 Tax=Naumovozyma dairenensis (strain ATCC 10597 / BCRC 20456 / CBS 421 / NBRC 0211 / NRRL Y-12639) TaxID=1071378 RepID=G0WBW6_NAUDC|nr:hypothetical protein NDAI_0E04190 [Naumovozyma dairenensis CBS 421]CCD25236.1 hypothetical protein NDAI_0E04190 [Naumovozyma dairenensis CBS 421]
MSNDNNNKGSDHPNPHNITPGPSSGALPMKPVLDHKFDDNNKNSNNANKHTLAQTLSSTLPKIKKQRRSDSIPLSGSESFNTTPNTNNNNINLNHRPVTSCSHCRQQKIKCDASQKFPSPCSRCIKMNLFCEIDPDFKPKKGSQIQILRRDVDDLKYKFDYLISNESLFGEFLHQQSMKAENGPNILENLNSMNASSSSQILKRSTATTVPTTSTNIDTKNISKDGNKNKIQTSPKNTKICVQTYLVGEPQLLRTETQSPITFKKDASSNATEFTRKDSVSSSHASLKKNLPPLLNDSAPTNNGKEGLPIALKMALHRNTSPPNSTSPSMPYNENNNNRNEQHVSTNQLGEKNNDKATNQNNKSESTITRTTDAQHKEHVIATTNTIAPLSSPHPITDLNIDEFVLGEVNISISKANELHSIFVKEYLPYFPILHTNSAIELYSQSQLLFWTVMLTACLSDPEPTMYIKLASLIKQLAVETCWMRTPRSTQISQALLILCIWPLPNQKVLDDCSYRFVALAKSLSYQLGLHRGKFIQEFTRTQTSMPNAEKWRTRTWLGIFFAELCWTSILGLPPTSQTDYLLENARLAQDEENDADDADGTTDSDQNSNGIDKLPKRFRRLICLANFQSKLCNVMGSSVMSPDGLMEPKDRGGALSILERELERLNRKLDFQSDIVIHIYYLYVKLTVCCFAFLPETPIEDQTQYVTDAYFCSTQIVTLLNKLLEKQQLIALPIYIRQSATFASLILFKLQLNPMMLDKYLDSARQSIVTIHRLFRNQLTAWTTGVENDISRTASMLEKLNMVLITHPEVFIEETGIISRMRSHLTGSLFYDLVWCVHEARRREMDPKYNKEAIEKAQQKRKAKDGDSPDLKIWEMKLYPLPLYNHISKEDFQTVTQTTPSGTTVTTLVPTKTALKNAETLAKSKNKDSDGIISEINGIPLSMLDATGSVQLDINELFHDTGNTSSFTTDAVMNSKTNSSHKLPPLVPANQPSLSKQPVKSNSNTEFASRSNGRVKNNTTITTSDENNITSNDDGNEPATVPSTRPLLSPVTSSIQRFNNPKSLFGNHNKSNVQLPEKLSQTNLNSMKSINSNNNNKNTITNSNNYNNNNNLIQQQSPSSSSLLPFSISHSNSFSNLNLFPPQVPTNDNNTTVSNMLNKYRTNTSAAADSRTNLNAPNTATNNNSNGTEPLQHTASRVQLNQLSDFFQQQTAGWIEDNLSNDDIFGWFGMDMEPKF